MTQTIYLLVSTIILNLITMRGLVSRVVTCILIFFTFLDRFLDPAVFFPVLNHVTLETFAILSHEILFELSSVWSVSFSFSVVSR